MTTIPQISHLVLSQLLGVLVDYVCDRSDEPRHAAKLGVPPVNF